LARQHGVQHIGKAGVVDRQQTHADAAVPVQRAVQQLGDQVRVRQTSPPTGAPSSLSSVTSNTGPHLGLQLEALAHA
jgi:hypothetical protein